MSERKSRNNRRCGCSTKENTVSKIIKSCCKHKTFSPQILTRYFITELLQELTALMASEKSQYRIDVISQISHVLSRMAFGDHENQRANRTDQKSSSSSQLDIISLVENLKGIDNLILELFEKKMLCYQQIANHPSYSSSMDTVNNQVTSRLECESRALKRKSFHIERSINNDQSSNLDHALVQMPTQQGSSDYFGNLTLRAASFCASKPFELKAEIDLSTMKMKNIDMTPICDHGALYMQGFDNCIICVSPSNQLFAMHFNSEFSLFLPEHVVPINIFIENIVQLARYNNRLFIVSSSGNICKCKQKGEIMKSFSIEENVRCVTDFEGVLYVVSVTDKLYAVNMRSMTLLKEPFQFDDDVLNLKVMHHENHQVMIYITRSGDIIARVISDGLPTPVIMKIECPDLDCIFFEICSASDSNMITLFCCTSLLSFGVCLYEPFTSHATTMPFQLDGPISAVLKQDKVLILGSFSGNITIIDIEKRTYYNYFKVVHEPITALARNGNRVYVSTLLRVICMVFTHHGLENM